MAGADGAVRVGPDEFSVTWSGRAGERTSPLADAVTVAFEDAGPVRSFASYRGQRHFPGWYWCASTGRHVAFESWLERDHAMLLDFDPEVADVLVILDDGVTGRAELTNTAGHTSRSSQPPPRS